MLFLFLGWLNKVRQDAEKEDLYVGNARFYLTKAKEVNVKNPTEDKEMVSKNLKPDVKAMSYLAHSSKFDWCNWLYFEFCPAS